MGKLQLRAMPISIPRITPLGTRHLVVRTLDDPAEAGGALRTLVLADINVSEC